MFTAVTKNGLAALPNLQAVSIKLEKSQKESANRLILGHLIKFLEKKNSCTVSFIHRITIKKTVQEFFFSKN